ncbi:hypothetical protein AAMO2058_001289700 [Amorphochlora amoebiformis]
MASTVRVGIIELLSPPVLVPTEYRVSIYLEDKCHLSSKLVTAKPARSPLDHFLRSTDEKKQPSVQASPSTPESRLDNDKGALGSKASSNSSLLKSTNSSAKLGSAAASEVRLQIEEEITLQTSGLGHGVTLVLESRNKPVIAGIRSNAPWRFAGLVYVSLAIVNPVKPLKRWFRLDPTPAIPQTNNSSSSHKPSSELVATPGGPPARSPPKTTSTAVPQLEQLLEIHVKIAHFPSFFSHFAPLVPSASTSQLGRRKSALSSSVPVGLAKERGGCGAGHSLRPAQRGSLARVPVLVGLIAGVRRELEFLSKWAEPLTSALSWETGGLLYMAAAAPAAAIVVRAIPAAMVPALPILAVIWVMIVNYYFVSRESGSEMFEDWDPRLRYVPLTAYESPAAVLYKDGGQDPSAEDSVEMVDAIMEIHITGEDCPDEFGHGASFVMGGPIVEVRLKKGHPVDEKKIAKRGSTHAGTLGVDYGWENDTVWVSLSYHAHLEVKYRRILNRDAPSAHESLLWAQSLVEFLSLTLERIHSIMLCRHPLKSAVAFGTTLIHLALLIAIPLPILLSTWAFLECTQVLWFSRVSPILFGTEYSAGEGWKGPLSLNLIKNFLDRMPLREDLYANEWTLPPRVIRQFVLQSEGGRQLYLTGETKLRKSTDAKLSRKGMRPIFAKRESLCRLLKSQSAILLDLAEAENRDQLAALLDDGDEGAVRERYAMPEEAKSLDDYEVKMLAEIRSEFHGMDEDIDDTYVLQFIRGYRDEKKGNPKEVTMQKFAAMLKLRKEFKLNNILQRRPRGYETYNRICKLGFLGCTKEGRPVYYERIGLYEPRDLTKLGFDRIRECHLRMQEEMRRLKQIISSRLGYRMYKHVVVLDLAGFGMKHMAGDIVKMLRKLMQLDSLLYPESMRRLYIVNAPWIFKTAWGLVSGLLHPVTAQRIKIYGGSSRDNLEKMSELIDPSEIPTFLGGGNDRELSGICSVQFESLAPGEESSDDETDRHTGTAHVVYAEPDEDDGEFKTAGFRVAPQPAGVQEESKGDRGNMVKRRPSLLSEVDLILPVDEKKADHETHHRDDNEGHSVLEEIETPHIPDQEKIRMALGVNAPSPAARRHKKKEYSSISFGHN